MAKTSSERVNEQLARNGQYWVKRFTAVEAMNHQNAQAAVDSIMPAFNKAEREIQKEINDWFIRFADNNEISLAKAQRMITGKALQELKWDIDDYIKYGRENAIDQRWMKELENASAKYHVSRLQALQIRTRQAAEVAFAKENEALADTLNGTYQSGYYHTAYEIQKGLGVGFDVGTIDQNKLDKLLKKPWTSDGLTFSDRIWRSKAQLIESLNTELTQMCILGKSPDEVVNNLTKRLEVSKSQAGRLVMTESAYFASAAQKECFKDLDVEEYEIVATLDSHTSDICRSMDGKHFPMKDFEAGVTAPPFHVWCRSTTVPYFNDEFTIGDTRAARGDDGKTYQVPSDMKYEDWKKSFVDGGSKNYNGTATDIFASPIGFADKADSDALDFYVNQMDDAEKKVWSKAFIDTDYELIDNNPNYISNYDPDKKKVFFNTHDDAFAAFHETAHAIDEGCVDFEYNVGSIQKPYMIQYSSASNFIDSMMDYSALTEDIRSFANTIGAKMNADNTWFEQGQDLFVLYNAYMKKISAQYGNIGVSSLSDIFSGVTNDEIGASFLWGGHDKSYWMRPSYGSTYQSKETWADFCALMGSRSNGLLEVLKDVLPNRYKYCDYVYRKAFEK